VIMHTNALSSAYDFNKQQSFSHELAITFHYIPHHYTTTSSSPYR
jgi:hypothetical protein